MTMKKIMLLPAALLLGLASCSNEAEMPVVESDGNVNITVNLPGNLGTRAFSDGLTADDLEVAVYDVTDADNPVLARKQDYKFGNSLSTKISLTLANGRSYKIALFASKKDNSPYTFNTADRKITVDYTKMTKYNSTDDYDCFYKLYEIAKVTGPIQDNILLVRPVAQINWGTNDLADQVLLPVYGQDNANLYTKVTTTAYTEFDMFKGNVVEGTTTAVNLPLMKRPTGETFPEVKEGTTYEYLSMQYLMVPKASSVVDLKLESAAAADATAAIATVMVANAPVQANYRTNIFGALLTNPADFTVTKKEAFEEPDNNVPVAYVENEADLKEALKNKGANITLNNDINITDGALSLTQNATIDLNGHTITSAGAPTYGDAFKVKGATVVFKNGTLAGPSTAHEHSGLLYIQKNSNVTLDNVTIDAAKGTPVYVQGEGSNLVIKSGKYTAQTHTQVVYVQKASKVVIEGGVFKTMTQDPTYLTNFTLNLNDKLTNVEGYQPTNHIEVKGGKFYKFNPAVSKSENPVANFVAPGFKSVQDGDWYVVSAE